MLQHFPGIDTHNLTQEWLRGRAGGTTKILVRQATGQTYKACAPAKRLLRFTGRHLLI